MKNKLKIIIIGISIIAISALGIAGYFYFRPYEVVNKDVYSFKYPKEFDISGGVVIEEANSITYRISNKKLEGSRSSIEMTLPIKDANRNFKWTLSEILKGNDAEFIPLIKNIEINGHKGEMVEYRIDRQLPGDRPIHATHIRLLLDSEYSDMSVWLHYFKDDTDPHSLNKAWEMLLKTLKY